METPDLSVWDYKLTVMRLLFSLVLPLFHTSRKGKVMRTPIDFEYDLWVSEDGKYMVRIKETGETCEVSQATMRFLRKEEKKHRRSKHGIPLECCPEEKKSLLSLSYVSVLGAEEMSPAWLEDCSCMEEDVEVKILEQAFRKSLTPAQCDIYSECLLGGHSCKEYADSKGVSYQSVQQAVMLIRKKAEKVFK